jgi:hypothetical protein
VTDVLPIMVIPGRLTTNGRTITSAKKVDSSCASPSIALYVSSSIPTIKTRTVDSVDTLHVVEKPYTMSSLYIDPIKNPDVPHNVATSGCDLSIVSPIETIVKTMMTSHLTLFLACFPVIFSRF